MCCERVWCGKTPGSLLGTVSLTAPSCPFACCLSPNNIPHGLCLVGSRLAGIGGMDSEARVPALSVNRPIVICQIFLRKGFTMGF